MVAFELSFRIVLTESSRGNRRFFTFTQEHPDVRWRVRDVHYTNTHAWLLTTVEAGPASLEAFRAALAEFRSAWAVEHRIVAEGPHFLVYYEKVRAPAADQEATVWQLVAAEIGLGAVIGYEGIPEGTRVRVVHESRDGLLRFLARLLKEDAYREVRLDSLRPVNPAPHAQDLTPEETALLSLAWRSGYYDRPRRVTLRDLAVVTGVPFTTIGYRLRGIETKAMAIALALGGGAGHLAPAPLAPADPEPADPSEFEPAPPA